MAAQIECLALLCEGRMTGDHTLLRDLRECGDDVLGEPIGKIFLFRVIRQVIEGRTAIDGRSVNGGTDSPFSPVGAV